MTRATGSRAGQRGFSLLELLVTIAILTLVLGVIFRQVDQVQKRYRTEEAKVDLTQESREFLDQIVRDVHQTGFPPRRMYPASGAGALNPANPAVWWQDTRVAVGLVKFSYTDLWFEADVDGDGQVESVRYHLKTDPVTGACPCTLQRSQVQKVAGTDPMAQLVSYTTGLDGLVNSGGVYKITGDTTLPGGVTTPNDTLYGPLKAAKIFTAYDASGKPVPPTDFNMDQALVPAQQQLPKIKTIAINLNVLVNDTQADLQTRMRPALSLTASAKISN